MKDLPSGEEGKTDSVCQYDSSILHNKHIDSPKDQFTPKINHETRWCHDKLLTLCKLVSLGHATCFNNQSARSDVSCPKSGWQTSGQRRERISSSVCFRNSRVCLKQA